jgi:hypothetical protein
LASIAINRELANMRQVAINDQHPILTASRGLLVEFRVLVGVVVLRLSFQFELVQRSLGLEVSESSAVLASEQMDGPAVVAGHDLIRGATALTMLPGLEVHSPERPILIVERASALLDAVCISARPQA